MKLSEICPGIRSAAVKRDTGGSEIKTEEIIDDAGCSLSPETKNISELAREILKLCNSKTGK